MRQDEVRVANALQCHFGVSYRPGEDPPDINLRFASGDVAVEISTLAQQVNDGKGGLHPRRSDDTPALRMIEELNTEMADQIPEGRHFLLILTAPLNNPRKAKVVARSLMMAMLSSSAGDTMNSEIDSQGDKIWVTLFTDDGTTKKVVGMLRNVSVGYDVLEVTRSMLEERIVTKAKKCVKALSAGRVWLALHGDYFFAELHNLQLVAKTDIVNPFDKIFLVELNGSISTIYEASPARLTAL